MAITVRPGVYLLDNPPAQRQFRETRRAPQKPVVVVHTAESGTDFEGVDNKAENVAAFMQRRTTYGSYHMLGDSDSIIQAIPFGYEAYHDASKMAGGERSNSCTIGVSLAMNSADWSSPKLTGWRRGRLIEVAAQMFFYAAKFLKEEIGRIPDPVYLPEKADSDRKDASGFTGHGVRDPGRRSDPGKDFPWTEVLALYTKYCQQAGLMPSGAPAASPAPQQVAPPVQPRPEPARPAATVHLERDPWAHVQELCNNLGAGLRVDGDPGPKTCQSIIQQLRRLQAIATSKVDTEAALAAWPEVVAVVQKHHRG